MADEPLNPADPTDAKLLDLKSRIERAPDWPQRKAEIERDNFIAPGSSADSNSAPSNKHDLRNAQLKANYESGKTQEAAPVDSTPPSMDFNAARTKFGEVLGVVPGTPEFDGVTAEFASWYDAHSTDPAFNDVVRKAEAMFGT